MKLQKFNSEHTPCIWWLRSADSDDSYDVGIVNNIGRVYNYYASYNVCVLQACIII